MKARKTLLVLALAAGLATSSRAQSFGLSFSTDNGGLNSFGFSYADGNFGIGLGLNNGYYPAVYDFGYYPGVYPVTWPVYAPYYPVYCVTSYPVYAPWYPAWGWTGWTGWNTWLGWSGWYGWGSCSAYNYPHHHPDPPHGGGGPPSPGHHWNQDVTWTTGYPHLNSTSARASQALHSSSRPYQTVGALAWNNNLGDSRSSWNASSHSARPLRYAPARPSSAWKPVAAGPSAPGPSRTYRPVPTSTWNNSSPRLSTSPRNQIGYSARAGRYQPVRSSQAWNEVSRSYQPANVAANRVRAAYAAPYLNGPTRDVRVPAYQPAPASRSWNGANAAASMPSRQRYSTSRAPSAWNVGRSAWSPAMNAGSARSFSPPRGGYSVPQRGGAAIRMNSGAAFGSGGGGSAPGHGRR